MKKSQNVLSGLLMVGLLSAAAITAVVASIPQQQQQVAYAITPAPCKGCAKEFAPGQEKIDSDFESTSAKPFAPGQEAKIEPVPCSSCNGASEFAPGQEVKIIGPE
jgi:hypothetical protein